MISETQLLDRFEHVARQREGDWLVRCPAHPDGRPSLHVTRKEARWLLHCLAGCSVHDVLAGAGLTVADLGEPSNRREPVAIYTYTDEAGQPLFEVGRFEPKRFLQRLPGREDWKGGIAGVRRVPFRLPTVIEAVRTGQLIHVVEGEKDVLAIEKAGGVATCNPGGAGKWRTEYSAVLLGAKVVIVADCDAPGRRHAENVARSLSGVAASVTVVEAAEGKDARDHLAAGRDLREFVGTDLQSGSSDRGRNLRAEAFSVIRAQRARWLWAGRIPLGAVTLLVGREKLGKSTLTCELAARLSNGTLDGELSGVRAAALLVSFEDSAARTVKPRLLAAEADVKRVHRIVVSRDGEDDLLSLPADTEVLGALAHETGARLLVVDPFSASLTSDVDGHRDQHVRRALAPLSAIAEREDLAVVLVAHWNKGQGGDPLSRVLGSRGLTAAVRSVLAFGVDPESEEGSAERVLAHAACNLAREAPSLGCRIDSATVHDGDQVLDTSRLVLGHETETTAGDLLRDRRTPDDDGETTARDEAKKLLHDELRDGPQSVGELRAAAAACGVSWRTVERAKVELGIEAKKSSKKGPWQWSLPRPPQDVGGLGNDDVGGLGKTPVDTGDRGSAFPRPPLSGVWRPWGFEHLGNRACDPQAGSPR